MLLVAKSTIPFIGDCFAWCMPYLYDHIFVAYKNKKQISDWCLLTLDSLDHIHETPNISWFSCRINEAIYEASKPLQALRASPGLTPVGFYKIWASERWTNSIHLGVHESARKLGYIYIYIYVVYIRCYRYTNVSKESCISVQSMSVCIHIYK